MEQEVRWELRVSRVKEEAEDIRSYELVPTDGRPLPPWDAGAHVDVEIPGGVLRRSYSLCGDPLERERWTIAVQREARGRGGSRALFEALQEGARIRVSPPKNGFPLAVAPRALLIAGGIGLTPLLAMARVLKRKGAEFTLHVCTRSPERTPFRAELSSKPLSAHVKLHHDGGDPARGLDVRQLLAHRPEGAHLYCCGPNGLMHAVREAALASGWPPEALHFEAFSPEPLVATSDKEGFELELRKSGRKVRVGAKQTVLQVLRAQGVNVMSDCEAGSCGTCLTNVLEGEIDHQDFFLTDEERAQGKRMCVCVSRAKGGRLVLDV